MREGIHRMVRLNGGRRAPEVHETWGGPAKLVIVTRHEFTAAGLEALLLQGGHRVLARCTGEDDLLRFLASNQPDTLLLNMVRREAITVIARLRADHPTTSIIFLLNERDVTTAASLLELDVEGILLSAACATSLLHCVDSVRHGRRWVDPDLLWHLALAEQTGHMSGRLTTREADIANLVTRGLRNKQIARELRLSEGTVKMHLHHIYDKLHLHGRTQLAVSAKEAPGDDPIKKSTNGHG